MKNFNDNLPVPSGTHRLIMGENVKPCPNCGKPLSFANDHYFCRSCLLGALFSLDSYVPDIEDVDTG